LALFSKERTKGLATHSEERANLDFMAWQNSSPELFVRSGEKSPDPRFSLIVGGMRRKHGRAAELATHLAKERFSNVPRVRFPRIPGFRLFRDGVHAKSGSEALRKVSNKSFVSVALLPTPSMIHVNQR
jgi:hypothetical protein